MKPDFDDIKILNSVIDSCINNEIDNNFIFINSFTYDIIKHMKRIKPKEDEIATTIKNIISDNHKYGHLSIRKITEIFNNSAKKNGKKIISKSKVHRIIKSVLNFSYRKTNIKTNKLVDEISLKYAFFF